MNKPWILKVLKIGVSKFDPRLTWIEGVHFREESIGVSFDDKVEIRYGYLVQYFF